MSRLWRRAWAIEVGPSGRTGTRYEGLTLSFGASYSHSEPAQCDVALVNPPREVVGALYDRETVCRVLAGYVDEGAVEVFLGTPIPGSVRDRRADEEPAVSWQLSASRSHAARATVSRTWRDVVRASEVIDYLRRALGLSAESIELPRDPVYHRGHVVLGPALPALAEAVATCGAVYSIEGGRLRIYPRGGSAPRRADEWSAASGLLDAAGPDGDGAVRASALLRPALRPGDVVAIRSPAWSGQVLVQSVTHDGATDGGTWATSIVGVPRG